MSFRICTRAAPRPSERLTPSLVTASPANRRPEMSFMASTGSAKTTASSHWNETPPWRQARVRSYGMHRRFYQIIALYCALLFGAVNPPFATAETPVHVMVLGDSLTAGYGLAVKDGFVSQLKAALALQGINVELADAGVSGDTASDGLARLDWSVPEGTDAVIVELGANDMLRGIDPRVTRDALEGIVRRLEQRRVAMLLAGMRAAANLGPEYRRDFDAIYSELAVRHDLLFYPFFLEGVAGEARLNHGAGIPPTAAGIDAILAR